MYLWLPDRQSLSFDRRTEIKNDDFCANTKCNLGDNTTSKSRGIKVICDDRGGRISAMTPSLMCNVGDNTSRRSRQVMIPPSLDHQPPSSCSRRWHNAPLRSESLKIKIRGVDPLKTSALWQKAGKAWWNTKYKFLDKSIPHCFKALNCTGTRVLIKSLGIEYDSKKVREINSNRIIT